MSRGLHWFRNDLRLHDNVALAELAARVEAWLPVFVVDPRLLVESGVQPPRTRFLLDCLARLAGDLEERGVPLIVRRGRPEKLLPELMRETRATLLSFNRDVTPFARERDRAVERAVVRDGGEILSRLDHVVFDSSEIRSGSGSGGPYSVYTPYRKTWWRQWKRQPRLPLRVGRLPGAIPGVESAPPPARNGWKHADDGARIPTGGEAAARRRLAQFLADSAGRYHEDRDRPDLDGTSRLSPYLRFGAISVRECVARGLEAGRAEPRLRSGIGKWLDELVWREFHSAILEEHPRVLHESHRREYATLVWNDDPDGFEAWCEGRTGYPIVDAGMRQLQETGWIHNRVRMIVASFLSKDLLIDWRAGERFFFERLVDGDPASNNGGWQWAASTGTDAQPYFRIFNPVSQGKRFDPHGAYVRRFVPELRGVPDRRVHEPWKLPAPPKAYPPPIVNHAERRLLALARYEQARAIGAGR